MHARAVARHDLALLGVALLTPLLAPGPPRAGTTVPRSSPIGAPPGYAPENTLAAVDQGGRR